MSWAETARPSSPRPKSKHPEMAVNEARAALRRKRYAEDSEYRKAAQESQKKSRQKRRIECPEIYESARERELQRAKWRRRNDPEYAARCRARSAAEYARTRESRRLSSRLSRRRSEANRLGISFDEMFEQQHGLCAICKTQLMKTGNSAHRIRVAAIDHDHTTGHVRGLLCGHCNQGLGRFRDSPEILRAAIDYLEKLR